MAVTTRQRVGLALAFVLSVGNIISITSPTPEGETGPPFIVLVLGALLGLLGVIGSAVAAKTGNRKLLRVVAGAVIVMAALAAPALFVPVPPGLKALVGATILVTIAAVVLMLSTRRDALTVRVQS